MYEWLNNNPLGEPGYWEVNYDINLLRELSMSIYKEENKVVNYDFASLYMEIIRKEHILPIKDYKISIEYKLG